MNEETKGLLEGVGIPLNYVYSCNAQLLLFANRKWIKEILQQGKFYSFQIIYKLNVLYCIYVFCC